MTDYIHDEWCATNGWPTCDCYVKTIREREAERDEAREIAGELARFARQIQRVHCTTTGRCSARLYHVEALEAWEAIRPGVRKWLEE